MTAPVPHGSLQRAPDPGVAQRRRQQAPPLVGVLLGWLRFTGMALVGVLGVWLLVLLFG